MVTKSPSDFINLISNFDPASGGQKRELENIIYEFPYFQLAHAIYLKSLKIQDQFNFDLILKKTAILSSKRKLIFNWIEDNDNNLFKILEKSTKKENRESIFQDTQIKGAVKNPGTYILNEGAGIYDLVTIAGGYTETAYPFGGILENVQTKEINEMAGEKLYESFLDELSRLSSNPAAASTDMTFLVEIINEIKKTKASGRVSAEFDLDKLKNDSSLDVFLQDGDVITIPEFLNHIYVFGEINTEGTIRFKEGAKVDYYIENKGGFNPYANKKNVYILHPNGETSLVSTKRNIFMSAKAKDIELYPGSVIFIPRDTIKVPFSVAAQAYASILGNIGVSLASVSVLKD